MICRRCGSRFETSDRWLGIHASYWGTRLEDWYHLCSGCHESFEEWVSGYHGPPLLEPKVPKEPFRCTDERLGLTRSK